MKRYWLLCSYLMPVLSILGQTGTGIVSNQTDAARLGSGGQRIEYKPQAERWVTVSSVKPFGLQALRINVLGIGWQWLGVTWKTGLLQQGDQVFWEQGYYVGAGRELSPTIHLSVTCQLYQRRIAGNSPSRLVPYPDLTLLYKPNPSLTFGCRLINPTGSRLDKEDGRSQLYQSINLGLSYTLHPDLTCLIEGCREPVHATTLHVGLTYTIVDQFVCLVGVAAPLSLRSGLADYPLQPGFGLKTNLKRIHLTAAWQLHAKLGATSGITVMYQLR